MNRRHLLTLLLILASTSTLVASSLAQGAYMTAIFKTQGKLKGKGPNGAVTLVGFQMNQASGKKNHGESSMTITYASASAGNAHDQLTRAESSKDVATTVTVSKLKQRKNAEAMVTEQTIMTNATFMALPALDGNTRVKITFAKFEIRHPQQSISSTSKGGYNARH